MAKMISMMIRPLARLIDNKMIMTLVLSLVAVGLGFVLNYNRAHKQDVHLSHHHEILSTAYRTSLQTYRLAADAIYTNTISHLDIASIFAEGVSSTGSQRDLARGRLYRWLYPQYLAMKDHNLLELLSPSTGPA